MGFLEIFELGTGTIDPLTDAGGSISDDQLKTILNLYYVPSFEESYELHEVTKPREMILCSSKTATIAAMVETDQRPTEILRKFDLDDTISAILWTASKTVLVSRKQKPVIFSSKWDNIYIYVVAAHARNDKCNVFVSIAAISQPAMFKGTDENIAVLAEVKQYLQDIRQDPNIPPKPKTLQLVLKLRGGARYIGGQTLDAFTRGDQQVSAQEDYDDFVSGIPTGSIMDKLFRHSIPTHPSETTVRNKGLCTEEQLRIGKVFRRTTYQAIGGELIITFRSFVRPGGGSIDVEGEGRFSGNRAGSLRFLAKRAIKLRENIELRGQDAQDKALADMKYFEEIRWWVLSCLIKGTLRVNYTSVMDGFIPRRINRVIEGGFKLMEPIDMEWLGEMGGTVATIGHDVIFRAHIKGEIFKVTDIGDDGVLTIGDRIYAGNEAEVFLWHGRNLRVARKSSVYAGDGILSRLMRVLLQYSAAADVHARH